jgi:hypothetical protein
MKFIGQFIGGAILLIMFGALVYGAVHVLEAVLYALMPLIRVVLVVLYIAWLGFLAFKALQFLKKGHFAGVFLCLLMFLFTSNPLYWWLKS